MPSFTLSDHCHPQEVSSQLGSSFRFEPGFFGCLFVCFLIITYQRKKRVEVILCPLKGFFLENSVIKARVNLHGFMMDL